MPYAEKNSKKNTTDKSTAATNAEQKPKEDKTPKHDSDTGTKTKHD